MEKEKIYFKLKEWQQKGEEDEEFIKELEEIKDSKEEVKDRFYKDLTFGTAGMRGVMGAGTNRMNIFVVRKMTQAFCEYLKRNKIKGSIAISYDSRHNSYRFAKETALVFAANDILVHIYEKLTPVPMLSFAVRELKCVAGVMITASHNPCEYNGYKVYGDDGCQLVEDIADEIYEISTKLDIFNSVKKIPFDDAVKSGKIKYIKRDVIDKYYENLLSCLINKDCLKDSKLSVVYTPLNGAGKEPVVDMFIKTKIKDYELVKEQEDPDPNFTTCKTPNPEMKEALEIGLKYLTQKKADLLIATDPDCDRLGVGVFKTMEKQEYVILNGNEIGILMFNYICQQLKCLNRMPTKPLAIKSIVSSNLVEEIAKHYGVEIINVLTGFKYIGEQILLLEKQKQEERFIFAFEESHGYLSKSYVRDKDGVFAAIFFCEIVAFYKKQNKTVIDVLEEIYNQYGFYINFVESFTFKGQEGMVKMQNIMKHLRESNLERIGKFEIKNRLDYLNKSFYDVEAKEEKELNCVKSNVLKYELKNKCVLVIRPSGTEPKIKIYYEIVEKTRKEAEILKEEVRKSFNFNEYLK